jgi:hypothetical protein
MASLLEHAGELLDALELMAGGDDESYSSQGDLAGKGQGRVREES